jgi:hypothetical protein
MLNLFEGKRRIGAVVNLAAIGAGNAAAILTFSTFASMVGVKTLRIKRLKVRNNNAGNTFLHIGTGVGAGVDGIPALYSIANSTDDYNEFDIPQVEFTGTIVAWPDAVGAGSFDVQVEAEEIG